MYFVIVLAIAAVLGLIPANIAKSKGHSFGLWWFYGWMLFIVAVIHVQFIDDLNHPKEQIPSTGVADELKKFKDLLDAGIISEEEFQAKKEQLLKTK